MTLLEQLEEKVILERLVIGLEEPVLIKGLGELQAKIDSGNGGYNVIHGTDFHQQGEELMFTTHDANGNEKKIQAKVIDTIQINMGGGNIEERPVIELDIKFAGEDYKKIPFSVSDRSTNTNPILISKGFVQDELQALIDVGATNISNDGIDVVYGESIMTQGIIDTAKAIYNAPKKVAQGVKKAADATGVSDVLGGVKKGLGRFMKNPLTALDDWLSGKTGLFSPLTNALGAAKDVATGAVKGGLKAGMAGIAGLGALTVGGISGALFFGAVGTAKSIKWALSKKGQESTKKQILNKLKKSKSPKLLKQKGEDVSGTLWASFDKINFNSLECYKIIDFTGKNGAGQMISKETNENLKKDLKDAAKAAKLEKKGKGDKNQLKNSNNNQQQQNQNQPQQQQEELLHEAIILLEDMDAMYYADKANRSNPSTSQETGNGIIAPKTNVQGVADDDADLERIKDSLQQLDKTVKHLDEFQLWFVPMTADKENPYNQSKLSKKSVQYYFYGNTFNNVFKKFYTIGKIDNSSVAPMIQIIAKQFTQNFKKNRQIKDEVSKLPKIPSANNNTNTKNEKSQFKPQENEEDPLVKSKLQYFKKKLNNEQDQEIIVEATQQPIQNDLHGLFVLTTGLEKEKNIFLYDDLKYLLYDNSAQTDDKKKLEVIKKAIEKIVDLDEIYDNSIITFKYLSQDRQDVIKNAKIAKQVKLTNIRDYFDIIARDKSVEEAQKLIGKIKNDIPNFLFYYSLTQSNIGKKIYEILGKKGFPPMNSEDELLHKLSKIDQIVKLLTPNDKKKTDDTNPDTEWDVYNSDVESEEEPWITSKLQQFRNKGII